MVEVDATENNGDDDDEEDEDDEVNINQLVSL